MKERVIFMKKKLLSVLLGISLVATMLAGCGSKNEATAETAETTTETAETTTETEKTDAGTTEGSSEKYMVGFIVGSREHVFYNLIEEAIETKCKELGLDYTILDGQLDANVMSDEIMDLTAQGCDAIALSCNDAAGVKPAIEAASAEGIAMFTFDCTCDSDAIISFAGTDNTEGGRLGAQEVLRLCKPGDKVAMIGYPTASSVLDRQTGFEEVIKAQSDIEYKFFGDYAGDANKAQQLMEDWLIQEPDLAAVFCAGDPAATGALAAIKAAGASTKVIGFDGNPEAKTAILDKEGNGKWWVSEISQNPSEIGSTITDQMYKYLTTGAVDSDFISISPYIITAENAAE
jgi:ribose transport system substrate-binding protein